MFVSGFRVLCLGFRISAKFKVLGGGCRSGKVDNAPLSRGLREKVPEPWGRNEA